MELTPEILALIEAGERAWPQLELERAGVGALLHGRIEAASPAPASALHAEDLYLAFGCAQSAPVALSLVEQRHLAPLAADLRRQREVAPLVDEAMQRLRERLLVPQGSAPGHIAEYAGRGPLGAWLRIAALRMVSQVRREQRPPVPADPALAVLPMVSPELALLRARDRLALEQAVLAGFQALTPEERNLLRLHLVDGLGLDRLSRLLGIHRATAARRVASARARLRQEVVGRLKVDLRLDTLELQSWVMLVRSQLSGRLEHLLGASAPSAP